MDGHVRRPVEVAARPERTGRTPGTNGEQELSVAGPFLDEMSARVYQIEVIGAVDEDAVRLVELALTPAIDDGAVSVQHHDGYGSPVEDIHVVFGVHRDRRRVPAETDPLRQGSPTGHRLVAGSLPAPPGLIPVHP